MGLKLELELELELWLGILSRGVLDFDLGV